METLFTLPLFILLCLQTFISVLILIPLSSISLPVSTLLKKFRKSSATASAVYTVVGAVALLTVASMVELSRGAERVRASGLRGEVLGTVDFLRAQVSFVLSLSNLFFLLLNLALAEKMCEADFSAKNHQALLRQVKGLQAAYAQATKDDKKDSAVDEVASEVAALKKQVDRLLGEKGRLEAEAAAGRKEASSAQASVLAMKKQIEGLDREFDRVLAENDALKAKHGEAKPIHKKDD